MNLLGFKIITCVSSFVPSVIPLAGSSLFQHVPASLCILRKCWMPCLLESFILYISPSQSSRWQCWPSNMILGGVGGVRMELIQDDVKSRKWQTVGSSHIKMHRICIYIIHCALAYLHTIYIKTTDLDGRQRIRSHLLRFTCSHVGLSHEDLTFARASLNLRACSNPAPP